MQNMIFTGTALALSRPLLANEDNNQPIVSVPKPLNVELLPQPGTKVSTLVAFSDSNTRVAIAAGTLENVSLYVDLIENPGNFEVLWSPTGDGSQIHSMAWSPDGGTVAFIATSLNLGCIPRSGKVSLYVVNVTSRVVQELIKIGEAIGQEEQIFVNINWDGGLTWHNNDTICVSSKDNAILTVDKTTSQISTLIEFESDDRVCDIAKTKSNELCFVKKTVLGNGQDGIRDYIYSFESGEITEHGQITLNTDRILWAKLNLDGDYVFLHTLTKVYIFDLSRRILIKEIPVVTRDSLYLHLYAPITILGSRELVLLDIVGLNSKAHSFYKDIQDLLSSDSDFYKKKRGKIVKVAL